MAQRAVQVRLVATDLDGTLLRPDGTVSRRTAAAVQAARDAGIEVVPVTGRPPRATWEVALDAGLGPLGACANGAALVDVGAMEVVELETIEAQVATSLVEVLRCSFPGAVFAVEQSHCLAYEPGFFETERLWEDLVVEVEDILAALSAATFKLIVRRPGSAATDLLAYLASGATLSRERSLERSQVPGGALRATELATGLGRPRESAEHVAGLTGRAIAGRPFGRFSVTSSGLDWVEIAAEGISKAYGAWRLCQRLGVDRSQVLAVGDYYNDLPLLGWAGYTAAPANALAEVREAAQLVIPSNADDGVAQLLEDLVADAGR